MRQQRRAIRPLLDEHQPQRVLAIDMHGMGDAARFCARAVHMFEAQPAHLVKAILNLAQGFGQETIAEGVEDDATHELLRKYGVDFVQGFHIGRPARLAQFEPRCEPSAK